ncbi:unnamed protein product [Paramecium sonneborni]|uniref:Uncharacterized protein n=1 Tax=Paramecium sonneborni TaxID=65129 RepID=A0A8S1K8I0_9CILI|nr:unnamed protein product [Paramecium sonneborni]
MSNYFYQILIQYIFKIKKVNIARQSFYQFTRQRNWKTSKGDKKQLHSFSILHKNNIVVKDHKKIILKSFRNNIKYFLILTNDIPLSERVVKRCNIAQKNCYFGLNTQTQQTQRSEFKSINGEICQSLLSKTQRNDKMDIIQERINTYQYILCEQRFKNYLNIEKQRLKLVEEQLKKISSYQKNQHKSLKYLLVIKPFQILLKVQINKFTKMGLILQTTEKLLKELYEFIQQAQIKFFKKEQEQIY